MATVLRAVALWWGLSQAAPSCPRSGLIMLQAGHRRHRRQAGLMTMWSGSPTTVVGGSCEYANAANSGIGSSAASSPYLAARAYCAADDALYNSGAACGSCWQVAYDGSPATDLGRPGSAVVQIVDSGSAKTFDCHLDVFKAITGASTGIFPITYTPVDCDVQGGPVATVLDGNNAWYTKVIFSNLVQAVVAAELYLAGRTFSMTRVSGATWSASPAGASGPAAFRVVLTSGAEVFFECFDSWPVESGSFCQTNTTSSTSPAPSTSSPATGSKTWAPVDGGENRACRGSSPWDNSPSYYAVEQASSLAACQRLCEARECVGVEFSGQRCELWTEDIESSKELSGFTCLRYAESAVLRPGTFEAVDGAWDRACRGSNPSDNTASYYEVVPQWNLEGCQRLCQQTENCHGIEFSYRRCELWRREIQASLFLQGFSCWRFK